MEHKVSECQISAVDYKPRTTKTWGTMLQMYSGVPKLRMEWNLLSLVPCPTKCLALKGNINFIQLIQGQMTNTHHIKMELFSQQRVFIGYFKVTWLLIMKLFPAKIWEGKITKSMTSEGNSALFPTTAVVRKQSMIEGGVMMAFGCQPIHGFEMAIFSRFADLSRQNLPALWKKDSKTTATKTALSTVLRCNTQGHMYWRHIFLRA